MSAPADMDNKDKAAVFSFIASSAGFAETGCVIPNKNAPAACSASDANPCCGNGQCVESGNKMKCECDSTHKGRFCDKTAGPND